MVSASLPSGPHMWPEVRIMAGMEASTMTSLGTCRLVMPLSESTMARAGPSASSASKDAWISAPTSGSEPRPLRMPPRPSLGVRRGGELVTVLGEGVREESADRVAEDDRVGDLHHGGLEVQREQHALGLGAGDLRGEELAQRGDAHDGRVDDLVLEDGYGLAEHGGGAVVAVQLDAERAVLGDDGGLLGGAEVVDAHGGDVRLRVGRPGAHAVRVGLGVVLDGGGGAAVGVALAQHRVHGAALDLVVPGADVLVGVGLRVVRVVRKRVALSLELGDGGLELRDGRRDVRQLDDVRAGRPGQLAQLGECVIDTLLGREVLRETGDDPAREGDVTALDRDACGRGVRLDDGQERVGRQGRGLVGVRIDDGRVSHRVLRSTSATLLDIKISLRGAGLHKAPRTASRSARVPVTAGSPGVTGSAAGARPSAGRPPTGRRGRSGAPPHGRGPGAGRRRGGRSG